MLCKEMNRGERGVIIHYILIKMAFNLSHCRLPCQMSGKLNMIFGNKFLSVIGSLFHLFIIVVVGFSAAPGSTPSRFFSEKLLFVCDV